MSDNIYPAISGLYGSDCNTAFIRGAKWAQDQLKTRIQPSDLQKEVDRLKQYYKELAVRTNLIFPSNETEIEWFNQGTDHSKSDFFTRFNKIIEALNK